MAWPEGHLEALPAQTTKSVPLWLSRDGPVGPAAYPWPASGSAAVPGLAAGTETAEELLEKSDPVARGDALDRSVGNALTRSTTIASGFNDTHPLLLANDAAGLPTQAVPTAPAPSGNPPIAAGFAPLQRSDWDHAVERVIETRQAGGGGEMRLTVAHAEFGPVGVRLDPSGGSLAATLMNLDPDFGSAVHAALAERTHAERLAAERVVSMLDTGRADTGARGTEGSQNGRNSAAADGSDRQHQNPHQSNAKAREWRHLPPHASADALLPMRERSGLFA